MPSPWTLLLVAAQAAEPPNFLVVIADDQRYDTIHYMDVVSTRLLDEGASFERAYVSTPLCCPFRASTLSGGFPARETGVLANEGDNGGPGRLVDDTTLATRFQDAGYATGLVGKYLTHYDEEAPRIPPGWTWFSAITDIETWYDHETLDGASGSEAAEGTLVRHAKYITYQERDGALDFLATHGQEPFLLFVTLASPHSPWRPATEDRGATPTVEHRPPSFDEEDVSDKPTWIQETERLGEVTIASIDRQIQNQLDCLLSIDRSVEQLLDRLERIGVADRTHVIYTSDNGYHWGEHRLNFKGVAYEESARVPLIWRAPGAAPVTISEPVLVDLDVPATLAALAGLAPHTSGTDLAAALAGDPLDRGPILLENLDSKPFPPWTAVIDGTVKLVSWSDGEVELYDLETDPHELDSLAGDPAWATRQAALQALVDAERGLSMPPQSLPGGRVGDPYEATLTAVGGDGALSWTAVEGLPAGIALSSDGVLSGSPTEAGTVRFDVVVTDSSTSPQHGGPQVLARTINLEIAEASPADSSAGESRCGCGGSSGTAAVLLLPWALLGRRRRDGPSGR